MPIIGFLGRRKQGKDVSCDYITKKHGYCKRSFAGPLKLCVKELFGFSDEQLYSDKKEDVDERWGISPRTIFQVFGTDIIRELLPRLLNRSDMGKNFHIKRFNIWYNENKDKHKGNVVINDVRFQNEVDYIKSKGGYIIKLSRCENKEKSDSHESESGVDNVSGYDILIHNTSTISNLYNMLDILVCKYSGNALENRV